MKCLLIPLTGIMISVLVIQEINRHIYSGYFRDLLPGRSTVRFEPSESELAKNYHVSFNVTESSGNYEFAYKFKDHNQKDWTWKWSYPKEVTDEMIDIFGVPFLVFEPYYPSDTATARRLKMIEDGLFVMEEDAIGPDLNRMIQYYQPFVEPIALLIENSLSDAASWRGKVEMTMKFVQDIPYGIPPPEQEDRYTGGVFPPPQVFVNSYGDCDSKVVIFSEILAFFQDYDILILEETGHILTALKGIPKPYDKYYEYRNNQYIMAETAGPGRNNLGVITDPYKKINQVIPVELE